MEVFKIKVVKNNGDFDKALKQGFAINNYACKESEMWLCMPSRQSLMSLIEKHKWPVLSEVEETH